MGRSVLLTTLAVAVLAPAAAAKRGDIYFETVRYAHNNLDAIHLMRIEAGTNAVSTVSSSTALPSVGQAMFARSDGTVLLSDGTGNAAVDSDTGQVRRLSFHAPGQHIDRINVPIALGFRSSGGADFVLAGSGIFSSGAGLSGKLRLLRGSVREGRPAGHIAGVTRRLVDRDGSIIGEVNTSSPGGRSVFTRFQRFDPRTRATRTIVDAQPIRSGGTNQVWGTLPGGGIVVATGRPQRTVFYVAKPRPGRWSVHRFAPPWKRPVDDGGLTITGLPGGDILILRQTTVDNGGFVLDEGIQILRMAPGGRMTTLYDLPPSADGDHALGVLAVQP
jgi:hypothetical protein